MKEAGVRGHIPALARRCEAPVLTVGTSLRGDEPLGLLGLRVVSEGLLQCRTQQWNSSMSNNTREKRGREEKEGKREGRKGRGGWGIQITSHHCYSPAQGQQQREACCPISCTVSAPRFLPRAEKDGDQRVHPPTHTHTAEREKCPARPGSGAITHFSPESRGTGEPSARRSRSAWCAAGACVAAAERGALCSSHSVCRTHMLGPLSLSHTRTSVNPFNSPAVPPLPLQRGEMNDFSELSHLSQAVPVRTGFSQLMRK